MKIFCVVLVYLTNATVCSFSSFLFLVSCFLYSLFRSKHKNQDDEDVKTEKQETHITRKLRLFISPNININKYKYILFNEIRQRIPLLLLRHLFIRKTIQNILNPSQRNMKSKKKVGIWRHKSLFFPMLYLSCCLTFQRTASSSTT